MGLLRTFDGRLDEAVSLLTEAALLDPVNGEILADLSAVHLERGLRDDRPLDLLSALENALDARRLSHSNAVALFNLALALDELGLKHQAAATWDRYLEVDEASSWALEARKRRRGDKATTGENTWTAARKEAERRIARGDARGAEELIGRFSAKAREEVGELLLGEWAEAVAGGHADEAERLFELSRLIGSVSSHRDGDRMVEDAIHALDAARRQGEAVLSEAVVAHRHLAAGIAARRGSDCETARNLLRDAAERLRRAGSPMAFLADLNQGICLSFEDNAAARDFLKGLASQISAKPYPGLFGRTSWMLGLAEANDGDFWSATARYRAAAEAFASSHDRAGSAGIETLLAEAYRRLGQHDLAWDHRLVAIRTLAALSDSAGMDRALDEAVIALVAENRLEAALVFQAEQIEHARVAKSREMSFAYVLMLQARLLRRAGRTDEATAALAEARTLASEMPPGAQRDRLDVNLKAEEATTLAALDPAAALEGFDEALTAFARSGYSARFPDLLHHRALARLATGDVTGAEDDLLRAIHVVEKRRVQPKDEEVRSALFEEAQPIYDSAIRFFLEQRSDPVRAEAVAGRAKGLSLLDAREEDRPGPASQAPQVDSLAAATEGWEPLMMPPGVVLVEYAVLPEKLVIWAVRGSHTEAVQVEVGAADLSRQLEALAPVRGEPSA